MKITAPFLQLFRGLRAAFSPNYVKGKLKNRKGKCKKCGACCKGCIFLDKKTKLCKTYGRRPWIMCYKEFPLDEKDQELWNVKRKCRYKFSNREKKP